MIRVADVVDRLEQFAPLRLAESWDNVGLICGNPGASCARIMTCLTVTPETADEAIAEGASLVVSHHPVLFRPVKSLRADRQETSSVYSLVRSGIAIYSPHTAFDNTSGGINDLLAQCVGLEEVSPLDPTKHEPQAKVVVFCPRTDQAQVLAAAFAAGAGHIGAYSECSFAAPGVGTFLGDETANPTIGQRGRREQVRERRVELICPLSGLDGVLAAIRAAHSYEEPAIDVYPLVPQTTGPGTGRLGRLPASETLASLASRCAAKLNAFGLQYCGNPERLVSRVAVACGAGDDFVAVAARRQADLLLTGEIRYHRALEAQTLGLAIIAAGHHATERPGVEQLARNLADWFPEILVWPSRRERDPLVHYLAGAKEKPPTGEVGGSD